MNQIKEYSEIQAGISMLREKFNFIPDCSNSNGYEICKNAYKEIRKVEINLDKKRKDLGEAARLRLKAVNSEADSINVELLSISSPFKLAKEAYEAEEAAKKERRINAIKEQIAGIERFVSEANGKNSSDISDIIQCVSLIDVAEHFDEFTQDALKTKQSTIDRLSEMMLIAVQRESAELEQRKARIESALVTISNYPMQFFGKTSEEIKNGIDELEQKNLSGFGEQESIARASVEVAMSQLNQMLEMAIRNEDILAKEAAQKAEQDRIASEAQANTQVEARPSFDETFNKVFEEEVQSNKVQATTVKALSLTRENLIEAVSVYFNINNVEAEAHLVNAFDSAQEVAA